MNFTITSLETVSNEFKKSGIFNFENACDFVAQLPYKRNSDKDNLLCIFHDNGGTCSTKHAVLRKLALENGVPKVKLILGIFKMDTEFNSKIKQTLEEFGLDYIPEAHNYLKIGDEYFDYTFPNSKYEDFLERLLSEQEMEYNQINNEKIEKHRNFLKNWLVGNSGYSLDEIWKIRERCIADLQQN